MSTQHDTPTEACPGCGHLSYTTPTAASHAEKCGTE